MGTPEDAEEAKVERKRRKRLMKDEAAKAKGATPEKRAAMGTPEDAEEARVERKRRKRMKDEAAKAKGATPEKRAAMGTLEDAEEAKVERKRLTKDEAAKAKGATPEKSTNGKRRKKERSGDAGDGKSSQKQYVVTSSSSGRSLKESSASSDILSVKAEPDDQDFTSQKMGVKRKRVKEESSSTSQKKTEAGPENKKVKKEKKGPERLKVKKEEEGEPKKTKTTKELAEEARRVKLKMKEEEEKKRWRWWEEEKYEDGVKWKFLEHKGPCFPAKYQPLPDGVRFYYDGKEVKLCAAAEEVALFFAQMLDHDYSTKDVFRENFFKDWRKEMNNEERMLISDLRKCDFGELHAMHKAKVEARKNMSKEEKLVIKQANQKIVEDYGFCLLDHHRERIGNFNIEPPGLFRGRGEHPKQGMLKKRIQPEDMIINCSRESKIPEAPTGHRWKEVRHDNSVTWLASWTENIQGSIKYIMLNANSKLKGEKDWEKYEVARKLKACVEGIRRQYTQDFSSKQMGTRQRAVALYFIDKLALRAGNEKEEGETADTVGCCSLRVEHITVHPHLDGSNFVVEFDFLGKDSIRYYNKVPVEKKVFKNLIIFMENKNPSDELFDRLNTGMLNKHLSSLMAGLTAKVFRTYNASTTLQQQLRRLSNKADNPAEKLLSYNRANRAVAVLCNHQRAPPKTFDQSMANLQAKIVARKEQLALAKVELKQAKKESKAKDDPKLQTLVERKKKAAERCAEQLLKMEVQATDREENKQIALGTSKLNYLDPRISVAWCKNMDVLLDKIYNKSQRDKFAWAIDMTEADFEF